MIMAQAIAW